MSRKLAAPSACPADLNGALARKSSGADRELLLAHVNRCEKCLAAIAESTRGGSRSSERAVAGPHEPSAFIEIGDVVGEKYRVEEMIGSGAMGSVYRAHHLKLRTDVALKVLRPERLQDVNAERRFSREARATSALTSPHAIRTFDIDRLPNGVPYIVMEYLDGSDLSATVIANGPLPVADAVSHLIAACDAVGEAHGLSIIHRDIKPANLFLTKSGVLKVLDFGLAKNLPQLLPEAGSEATKTNFILGSPHYMSPEQLRSAKEVDARADIWSLGATLFHLLCGVPPFFGTNLYVLIALILNDDAPKITSKIPSAPPELDAIVARCLRRDRDDRYASCAALRRDLEEVLAGLHAAEMSDPTRQYPTDKEKADRARRRNAMTMSVDEAREALSGTGELLDSGDDMYIATMDAPVNTVPSPVQSVPAPAPTMRSSEGLASFADPSDDAEPTALAQSPFDSAPLKSAAPDLPGAALPRLYDEEPTSDPNEHAGTMLMPRTMDRLLAKAPGVAPGGPPRVYDDDVDLLPDMTKVMLETPPHLKAPSSPAFPAWTKQTAPMPQVHLPAAGIGPSRLATISSVGKLPAASTAPLARPLAVVAPVVAPVFAPTPRAASLPTVRTKAAPRSASHLGGIILVGFALLLLIAALITLWSVS